MPSGWILPQIPRLVILSLLILWGSPSESLSFFFFSCQSTAAVVALYLYANNILPLHRDKMDRSLSILPCRLAVLYSALLRDNGRVDTDVSESFISRCECHYVLLVLMFILRIPHSCKCQFMQSGAFVCTAFGGPLGLMARVCVHVTPQNVAQVVISCWLLWLNEEIFLGRELYLFWSTIFFSQMVQA